MSCQFINFTDISYPNYSQNIPPYNDSSWKSTGNFSYQVLSGIYEVASDNLATIFPRNEDLRACKPNPEDPLDTGICGDEVDLSLLLEDFAGPAAYFGAWAAVAVLFTIVGIVWCLCNKCCCCCKRWDDNDLDYLVDNEYESENAKQKGGSTIWKIIAAICMLAWIIGLSFSVFTTFAANEGFRRAMFMVYDDASYALDDAESYLNITREQIDGTFSVSFGNLADEIRKIFDSIPPEMSEILEQAIQQTQVEVTAYSNSITNALGEVPIANLSKTLDDAEGTVEIVNSAAYGSLMGFNLILLLVLIGVILGSVLVWVGRGSARNTGFIFYRFSIATIFIFGLLITLVMVTTFVISGFMIHNVCTAIKDADNYTEGSTEGGGEGEYLIPTYPYILNECRENHSAYQALKLEQVFNVSEILTISDNFQNLFDQIVIPIPPGYRGARVMDGIGTSQVEFNETIAKIVSLVNHYECFVYDQVSYEIGRCGPVYRALNATIDAVCYKIMVPVAVYWWGLQLLCIMFGAIVVTALISERVFK